MGKVSDKVNSIIEDWIQFQVSHLSGMASHAVRIKIEGRQFYGSLEFGKKHLIIFADDEDNDSVLVEVRHMNGFKEIGNRGLKFIRRSPRSSVSIFLRTPKEREVVLKKLRTLTGNESTSSSSPEEASSTPGSDDSTN